MMDFRLRQMGERSEALSYLRLRREEDANFGVIDVGAIDHPWTADYLLATVDLKEARTELLHFQGNINDPEVWRQALDHVAVHGKFPFSVCTHTLEDIAYPSLTLRMLPLISKAGMIAVPSYRRELSRSLEGGSWRGYIHHRWMFTERGGKLLLIPKVCFIEQEGFPSDCPGDQTELQLYWEDSLQFEVINDDYLGPNVQCVRDMYREVLR